MTKRRNLFSLPKNPDLQFYFIPTSSLEDFWEDNPFFKS